MALKDVREWATLVVSSAALFCVAWQARNSTEAINIARESYSAVQRPFITADIRMTQSPNYWNMAIVAQNSGTTPTKGLKYSGIVSFSPTNPNAINDSQSSDKYTGHLLIGPKGEKTLPLSQQGFALANLAQHARDRREFYVSGLIHYQSHFRDSLTYLTKFCFGIIPSLASDGSLTVSTQPCRFWNCQDGDCEADDAEYAAAARESNPK